MMYSKKPILAFTDNKGNQLRFDILLEENGKVLEKIVRMALEIKLAGVQLVHVPGIYNMLADELSRSEPDLVDSPDYLNSVLGSSDKFGVEDTERESDEILVITRQDAREAASEKQRISLPVLESTIRKRFNVPNESTLILPVERIVKSYAKFKYKAKKEDIEDSNLIFRKSSEGNLVILIPDEDKALQELIITIAHCTLSGHPNKRLTAQKLARQFMWKDLKVDAEKFVDNCLTCKAVKPPFKFSAPYGIIRNPTEIFSILGFDIADPGVESRDGFKYILVMIDMFSSLVNFKPLRTKDGGEVAEKVIEYVAFYLPPLSMYSDQGTNFTSSFMKRVAEILGASQFFSFAHVEFSRAEIEQAVGNLKTKLRALITDSKGQANQWPKYLPAVQMAVNNLESPSLGMLSPNHIVFGTSRPPQTIIILDRDTERIFSEKMDEKLKSRINEIASARNCYHFYLQKFYEKREETLRNDEKVRSRKFPLTKGDFVLVAAKEKPNSITPTWIRPSKILERVSDWEYQIEDLETKEKSNQHVSNLRSLNEKDLGKRLNDDGLALWLALTEHDISHISEFRLEAEKLFCKIHFNKRKTAKWEVVKDWIKKIPNYFKLFVENPVLIPNENILKSLSSLIPK